VETTRRTLWLGESCESDFLPGSWNANCAESILHHHCITGYRWEKSRNVLTNIAAPSEASQSEADFPLIGDAGGRPLVAVAGPTGSGKSGLALEIAAAFGGEVVNAIPLQVYRYFDIGTANCRSKTGVAFRTI